MWPSVALGLRSTRGCGVQRLLWSGSVLDRRSASLREVPKDWLLSLGVQPDVEQVRREPVSAFFPLQRWLY